MLRIETFAPARRCTAPSTSSLRRGITRHDLDAELYVPGLEGPAGMPLVTDALLRRGLPEATIRKVLGENLVRVLSKE